MSATTETLQLYEVIPEPDSEQLSAVTNQLMELAQAEAPLQPSIFDGYHAVGTFSLPSEVYKRTSDGGIYRILHTQLGDDVYIELDYFPDNSKDFKEPINKLSAAIPIQEYPFYTNPEFRHNHEPTIVLIREASGQASEQITCSDALATPHDIREIKKFISDALANMSGNRSSIDINVGNLVRADFLEDDSRLIYTDESSREVVYLRNKVNKYLQYAQKDNDAVLEEQRSVEAEIARATEAEIKREGRGFSGDFEGDSPIIKRDPHYQLERMHEAVKAAQYRNRHRETGLIKTKYLDFSAGFIPSLIFPGANEEVVKFLRENLKHESKIPPEGLTRVPEGHLLVMIGGHSTHRINKERPIFNNPIYAIADDQARFSKPFYFYPGQEKDGYGTEVTFLDPDQINLQSPYNYYLHSNTGLRAEGGTYTQRNIKYTYGNRYVEHKKAEKNVDINRLMLIGPGDNVSVRNGREPESGEYVVSNVDGNLYVDGKKISSHDKRRYKKHLYEILINHKDKLVKK